MVSIIIPYYNAGKFLEETLESVFCQEGVEIEVIVVDDGSDEINTKKLTRLSEQYNFKLVYQENKGVSSARNKGAQYAKGQFLLFLDADDLLLKGQLNNLLKMSAEDSIAVANCIGSTNKRIFSPVFTMASFFSGIQIQVGTALIPKHLFFKVNGFNEALTYSEDIDLWFRLWRENIDFKYLDTVVLNYRIHDTSAMRKNTNPRLYFDNLKSFQYRLNFFHKSKLDDIQKKQIVKQKLNSLHWYAKEFGLKTILTNYWWSFRLGCFWFLLKNHFKGDIKSLVLK